MQRRGIVIGTTEEDGLLPRRGRGAAGRDVRLRHRPALGDPGQGRVHDGVRALRPGAGRGDEGAPGEVRRQAQGRRRSSPPARGFDVSQVPERAQPAATAREGAARRSRARQSGRGARRPRRRQDARSWSASRSTSCCAAATCCTSSLDHTVAHVRAYYDTVFDDLAADDAPRGRRPSPTRRSTAAAASASIRASEFSSAKLREAVKVETEAGSRARPW